MLDVLNVDDIIEKAKTRADLRNSEFLNNDDWEDLVSDSYNDLYNDILDLKTGHFLVELDDLEPDDEGRIFLPTDFHKMRLFSQKLGTNHYCPLMQKTLIEVSNSSLIQYYFGSVAFGYILFDDHLKVYPIDSSKSLKYKMDYGKALDIYGDQVNNLFFRYLKYQAAYLATVIDKNPNDGIGAIANQWRSKILKWASVRDSSPKVVKDYEYSPMDEVY